MGLGAEFLNILKDTVKLTDSVERLNTANMKLQEKVEHISDRLIRVETRLDTYVEIGQSKKQLTKK